MKQEIIASINNPAQLEKLYRKDKASFRKAFGFVYAEIKDTATAQVWHERLNFEGNEISWGTGKELIFVVVASFLAGLVAKIPDFTATDTDFFYPRNVAFIVFPFLTAYFAWKQKAGTGRRVAVSAVVLVAAVYMNTLPANDKSDTLILACVHLPLFLWAVLGFTYAGEKPNDYQKRVEFLRYNGDLIVMTAIILLAGGLLTVVTIGLFSLIGFRMEEFYFQYVGIWGLSAAPIVGTYLVQTNPQLVDKVSPVIAKVFTPLVLVMLVMYLVAVIYTGKDPYNDREFLLVFNMLLIGVMALILFSVVENARNAGRSLARFLLMALAVITVAVNGIALSAILFRISEWGVTPNRLAVLGGNILILTNLLAVAYRLFRTVKNPGEMEKVEDCIASFLPVYSVWVMLVTFVFPLLFHFR